MITGENDAPTSNIAKKQIARAVKTGYYDQMVMMINSTVDEPTISFGPKNARPPLYPHDDALVFSAEVGGCLIHRIFVDSGIIVNILYLECWKAMDLEATIEPTNAPLYGFSGESVMPIGMIELPITMGRINESKTRMVRFLIIDTPKPSYNIILGRPALNTFKAVVSTLYLKMKFSIDGGRIGEIWGDQATSKECHVRVLTQWAGQKRERHLDRVGTVKIGNVRAITATAPEREKIAMLKQGTEKQPLVTTNEAYLLIELFMDREGYTTKIGARMAPVLQKEMVSCLRRNSDVFAFSTTDLKGIDRSLAEHCLNVDPKVKPVKQKMRYFSVEKDVAIREQVQGLLDAGHIIEVQYPDWISNAVMVEKKIRVWWMCVDYKDLNAACLKDCYPLPRMDQLVDDTSGCELLSMMDAYQGYHQVKMDPDDVIKRPLLSVQECLHG